MVASSLSNTHSTNSLSNNNNNNNISSLNLSSGREWEREREREEWMKANVDSLLRLKTEEKLVDYLAFLSLSQTHKPSRIALCLFLMTIFLPFSLASLASLSSSSSKTVPLVFFLLLLSLCFFLLLSHFLLFEFSSLPPSFTSFLPGLLPLSKDNLLTFRLFLSFAIPLFFIIHFLYRIQQGACPSSSSTSSSLASLSSTFFCNPEAGERGVPIYSLLLLSFLPLLLPLVFKELPPIFRSLQLFLVLLGFLVGYSLLNFSSSCVLVCLIQIFAGLAILYESRLSLLSLFFAFSTLRKALEENERRADELHATEMRHMIGNVAHDLKTPLTSFLSGIEFIAQVTGELKGKTKADAQTTTTTRVSSSNPNLSSNEEMLSGLQAISSCTKNMAATNHFMLMAINRCIDYTKASKGLKLNPKYETIDLMEAIALPIGCVNDVQGSIRIHLNPFPREVCSHIITDKQWFQENLLCLLSNAVKYSSEGLVTISLSLHFEKRASIITKMKSMLISKKIYPEDQDGGEDVDEKEVLEGVNKALAAASARFLENERDEEAGNNLSSGNNSDRSATTSKPIRALQPKGYLRIEVEDTGIGIEEEMMENLFSPFKQAQRMAGGTGLGLYSLAKRMDALKGKYGVRGRRDGKQGSLFWFEFPYRPDRFTANMSKHNLNPEMVHSKSAYHPLSPQSSAAMTFPTTESDNSICVDRARSPRHLKYQEETPTARIHSTSHAPLHNVGVNHIPSVPSFVMKVPKNSLNILLVDDSPSILKMTSMMLKRGGHRITTATNGNEALQKIISNIQSCAIHFDVILMDLQMPVMDGLEATRRIRRLETTGNIHSSKKMDAADRKKVDSVTFLNPELSITRHIIIGCSANSDDDAIEEAYRSGVDSFMPKPFSIDSFYQTYEEVTHHEEIKSLPLESEKQSKKSISPKRALSLLFSQSGSRRNTYPSPSYLDSSHL